MSILCQILVVLAIFRHSFQLGLSRDFKNYQNLTKITSKFYFTATSWFPGNVRVTRPPLPFKTHLGRGSWTHDPQPLKVPTSLNKGRRFREHSFSWLCYDFCLSESSSTRFSSLKSIFQCQDVDFFSCIFCQKDGAERKPTQWGQLFWNM